MDAFLFCLMAAQVLPAHNPFMSLKPLANVSQKSFRHFLLITEITFAPVKGVVPVLLLKDYLSPSAPTCHMEHVSCHTCLS